MKVLILYEGDYGKRFWENISQHAPKTWEVLRYHYTKRISTFVEELADYLPQNLPACDLLLSVQEHPVVAEMIPLFIKEIGARAVIAPVDNKAYLTSGLARQIRKKLEGKGIEFLHPMTFCTLSEKMAKGEFVMEFVKHFGKPEVEIDFEKEKVKKVRVIRDAPCGNTRYVAEHLIETHLKDAVEKAGILHHNHPCMATMAMDAELGDTLMHHAGLQAKLAVEEAIKKFRLKRFDKGADIMKAARPYYQVNVLTGFKTARLIENPLESAKLIKKAQRPLFVVGARILEWTLNGKLVAEYAAEIVKEGNIPVCATAHTKKKLVELGITPECTYDIIEIINHLKDRKWQGVRKEGNHDLVIFLGVRADLASQGLSTLKHFAPHLKTMTLSPFYYPNADYSLPNLKDDKKKWKEFYENLIAKLKDKEEEK